MCLLKISSSIFVPIMKHSYGLGMTYVAQKNWLVKYFFSSYWNIHTETSVCPNIFFFPNICLSKLKTSFSPHLCLSKPKLWSKLKRVLFIFVSDPPNSKVAYAPDNPNAVIWNIYSGGGSVLNLQKFLIFFIIQFSVIQDDK